MYTKQEKRVLEQILKAKSNQEIADTLFISRHTVKAHVEHLLKKSNTSSRIELIIKTMNEEIERLRNIITENDIPLQ